MPELLPPPARAVVVVAPHADDETLGCGGTMALWRRAGVPVRVVVLSDGAAAAPTVGMEPTRLVALRESEATAAAAILGIPEPSFLRLPDGRLAEHRFRIGSEVERLVREMGADLVLAPSPTDYHPDHLAAAEACFAVFAGGGFALGLYEVYGTTRFNVLVDITEVQEVKERALGAYQHGFLGAPEVFVEANRGLARFRSFHARRQGYFEAFWHLPRFTGEDQLVNWILGGLAMPDPAAALLSKLRATDALLAEVGRLAEQLAARDGEIAALRAQLEAITTSRGWRALDRFRRVRGRLLPRRGGGR